VLTRAVVDRTLDVTSAEWIVEAPSECSGSDCTVLRLADFGTAHFLSAGATTTTGITRSLTRAPWTRTRISLGSSFEQGTDGADLQTRVTATPSALADPLGAFGVSYLRRELDDDHDHRAERAAVDGARRSRRSFGLMHRVPGRIRA
jgi:hypothetical protein